MKRLTILILPLLAACQHTEPGIKVIYRDKPIPMPCIPLDEIPEEPDRVGDLLNGDAEHDLILMTGRAIALLAWGEKMNSALTACASEEAPSP